MKPTTPEEIADCLECPLDNLTAEEARNCVKVFEGLPYSPQEVHQAQAVAKEISRHARLGFTEFYPENILLSDKLVQHLRSRGFIVECRYQVKSCGLRWDRKTGIYLDETSFLVSLGFFIRWGELKLEPPVEGFEEGHWYATKEEAEAAKQVLTDRESLRSKEREEAADKQKVESPDPVQEAVHKGTKPMQLGCLLFLVPGILATLYLLT